MHWWASSCNKARGALCRTSALSQWTQVFSSFYIKHESFILCRCFFIYGPGRFFFDGHSSSSVSVMRQWNQNSAKKIIYSMMSTKTVMERFHTQQWHANGKEYIFLQDLYFNRKNKYKHFMFIFIVVLFALILIL